MKRLWLKAYNGASDRCRGGETVAPSLCISFSRHISLQFDARQQHVCLTTDGEAVSLSDMAIAPRRREEPAVQAVDQSLEVNDGCVPSRLL